MSRIMVLLFRSLEAYVVACMRPPRWVFAVAVICACFGLAPHPAAAQSTLAAIRQRGVVRCGVSEGLPGFSVKDKSGAWVGFDVDLCRALAAAIFNDPSKVAFTPISTENRFGPLISGAIDVLSRNTTWTLSREAGLGVQFPVVTYYDGQGFMVRKSAAVNSALDLDGASICVQSATTTQLNLADYFRDNNKSYKEVEFTTPAEATKAYLGDRCSVVTADVSQLYAERTVLPKPDENVILPEVISKEPLGPAVREGDDRWLNVVKWTFYAMVGAEELGIGQKTLDVAAASEKAPVRRLLGTYGALGEALGLTNDWAVRIIRGVGNYGESFDRNLGAGSPLGIPRGLNQLWNKGGLQYSPPLI